jgi:uncharacterized protein (TIGR03435 family)
MREIGSQRRRGYCRLLAVAALALVGCFVPIVFAQNAGMSEITGAGSKPPEFEVASIRPSNPNNLTPHFIPSPDRFTATGVPVINLVYFAYNIKYGYVSGGPSWFANDRYDVNATVDPSLAEAMKKMDARERYAQLRSLVRELLKDRFKLQVKVQTKELPIYALVVAKGGPKLKPSAPPAAGDTPTPAKWSTSALNGVMKIAATNAEMVGLAGNLMVQPAVGRQVVDETGLKGNYDYALKWALNPDSPNASAPDIFTALQEQLGLKLDSRKGPVDTLVVEHVERPSEN